MRLRALPRILSAILLGALLCQPAGRPANAFQMELCADCRRHWNDSPCRMRMVLEVAGRQKRLLVCSPFCLAERLEHYPGIEPLSVQVVDWKERDEPGATMLNASRAHFLTGIDGDDQDTHEPYVAAFGPEKAALEAKKELGGELASWDELLEECTKLAADYEAPQWERRFKPLRRNRH